MHLPVAREEIAHFLEINPTGVDQLWHSKRLQRTISCPYRDSPLLNWSSQYDVLEYALVSDDLPVRLSKEGAALWILILAEADEDEAFRNFTLEGQIDHLVSMAFQDGFATDVSTCVRIATTIFASRFALNNLCQEADLIDA